MIGNANTIRTMERRADKTSSDKQCVLGLNTKHLSADDAKSKYADTAMAAKRLCTLVHWSTAITRPPTEYLAPFLTQSVSTHTHTLVVAEYCEWTDSALSNPTVQLKFTHHANHVIRCICPSKNFSLLRLRGREK